jgi:bla regulator protein blaR1
MKRLSLMAAACAAFAIPAFVQGPILGAQTPANQTFEVASVKPNKTGDGRIMFGLQPGGRFNATNVTLRMLLRQAFNVQEFQITGGPDWMASDRFDVVAKAPEGEFTADLMRPMLRSLLAERFKLVVHNETREMAIYALVKARDDGKLGPNLSPAAIDCAAVMRGRRGGPPPTPPQPGQKLECGFMIGPGRMNAGGMPLSNLAQTLSPQVGRIVLDKTELTGNYDLELTYSLEGLGSVFPGGGPPLINGAPAPIDPNQPNLFTALQEQLGLKLDSQRGPVDVVVIDSVQQPVAD